MRIPSNKPPVLDPPTTREKRPAEGPAKADVQPRADAAIAAPSLDRVAQDADVASREFEQTIAARLDQVREQLRGGSYAVNYDKLAQRLMEEGFGA